MKQKCTVNTALNTVLNTQLARHNPPPEVGPVDD